MVRGGGKRAIVKVLEKGDGLRLGKRWVVKWGGLRV